MISDFLNVNICLMYFSDIFVIIPSLDSGISMVLLENNICRTRTCAKRGNIIKKKVVFYFSKMLVGSIVF